MNKYKAHQNLVKKSKLAIQNHFGRSLKVFDRHIGLFTTNYGARVQINKKGMADLYILISCHNILIHIEAEAKTGSAVQSKPQKEWQQMIESMGGCYVLFRSEQDLIDGIENYLRSRKLL